MSFSASSGFGKGLASANLHEASMAASTSLSIAAKPASSSWPCALSWSTSRAIGSLPAAFQRSISALSRGSG